MTAIETKIPGLTLRHATADDAALVLAFMKKLGAYQKMADEITASEAKLARLLREGHGEAVFGLDRDHPVGFMFFSGTSSAFTGRSGLFIDGFFVEDTLRGRGVGKVMMAYLSRLALARGGEMLEWGCLDWNQDAIEFYNGLGAYCLDIMHIYRLPPDRLTELSGRF